MLRIAYEIPDFIFIFNDTVIFSLVQLHIDNLLIFTDLYTLKFTAALFLSKIGRLMVVAAVSVSLTKVNCS